MKSLVRGLAALMLAATLLPAAAQDTAPAAVGAPSTERARISYMVGMDVGASLRRAGSDLDLPAFERSLRNSLAGGEPLLDPGKLQETMAALVARSQPAPGQPPGTPAPPVDPTDAALAVGIAVGSSLAPISEELDIAVLMGALRTVLAGGAPLLSREDYMQVRNAFGQKMQARAQAQAAALGARNAAEGAAFLAANKDKPGVVTTGSGLQYMVLREGSGPRPKASDTVRVHYRGTLLDGTEFDSSHARNAPAEFALDQVVPGWTEGVALMPVGARYRFWIPAGLAYGAKGTPGGPIGPNATLVFDVELLDIL